jgi:hypothetical protein
MGRTMDDMQSINFMLTPSLKTGNRLPKAWGGILQCKNCGDLAVAPSWPLGAKHWA